MPASNVAEMAALSYVGQRPDLRVVGGRAFRRRGEREARSLGQEVIERFGKAEGKRNTWDSHWQDCYQLFLPQRDQFSNQGETPGQKKNLHVYDSTPVRASYKFASRVMLTLLPPFRRWVRLEAGSDVPPRARPGINKLLEESTEILFDYIDQSNLATEGHEACLDLAISTGAMQIQDSNEPSILQFQAVPLKELYLEEGPWGSVETVFRPRKMQVRNIMREWPAADLPAEVAQAYAKNPDLELEIVEATIFRPITQTYTYAVVAKEKKALLFQDELEQSPWVVFRWSTLAGEIYGRGPAMEALPDARTLNRLTELVLRNAALAISGAYVGMPDGLFNPHTARIRPGGIVPVKNIDALKALQTSHDFAVSDLVAADLRDAIRESMLARDLGAMDDTQRTATEMLMRQQELIRDAGSSFGRLQRELVNQIVTKAVWLLQRNGKLPEFMVDGREVRVRPISPLARAQDQEDLVIWQTLWEQVSQLGPEVAMLGVKVEDVPEYLADKLGLPSKLMRTERERGQLQVMVAKMMAEGQQMPAPETGAGAAVVPQSPLALAA